MDRDEEGFIWAGSTHRTLHRYDPRTGKVENVALPFDATASACLSAAGKVYVLGQRYPRLIIYDRAAKRFRETAYPSTTPDVWYGTRGNDPRFLYLFDRGSTGLIKWNVQSDNGVAIRYPYPTPLPASGRYEDRDGAIWCGVWDLANIASYRPLGLARFDLATDQFTGWWPFPKTAEEAAELPPYTDPASVFFVPWTLRGKIVPFDFCRKRWHRPLDVPEYGKRFGFIGGPWLHGGRYYFSLSTYDGDDLGCDGQPYHFCNSILEFDPDARRFEFRTLEVNDAYYQIAYMLSAGGEFFVTGSNIREPDGRLNGNRAGEVVFWQTLKVGQ